MEAKKQQSLIGQYVLVGTDRTVLAAGVLTAYDVEKRTATLTEARQVLYWPREARGAFGVAARGVPSGGRVSPAVPRAEVLGVTGVLACTSEAQRSIEAEPWS